MLDKEQLKKRLKKKSVARGELPDGTEFFVRKLSAADVLDSLYGREELSRGKQTALVVQLCLCDMNGKRELDDSSEGLEMLADMDYPDLEAIANKALAHNGLGGDEKKDGAS